MKYKAKYPIPLHDSYKGLRTKDWELLNAGQEVELKFVPLKAQPYLEKVTKKKEVKTDG